MRIGTPIGTYRYTHRVITPPPQVLQRRARHNPGDFSVAIRPSRRLARYVDLTSTSRLESIQDICTSNPTMDDPDKPDHCLQLIGGVLVNGRRYKQGDHIEYSPNGRGDSALGTINLFYSFGSEATPMVFLETTVFSSL